MGGITAFAPPPGEYYRYVIKLKNETRSMLPGNLTSKKQWGSISKDDYVTSTNAIPGASAIDYVKCFHESLKCNLNDRREAQRKLKSLNDGVIRLRMAVEMRAFHSTWGVKFSFDLDPVSVERIDILKVKLQDQQEQQEELRRAFLQFKTTKQLDSATLYWYGEDFDDLT